MWLITTSEKIRNKKVGETEKQSESSNQNEVTHGKLEPEIEIKSPKDNQEKILQGKTLQVYWYILTHRNTGVRKIQ